ncbi:MAG: mannitol dehydrogenase family protein [Planctomycetota bacterium]|jgi:mannitol-1-phosphate 5-dehydrogenase
MKDSVVIFGAGAVGRGLIARVLAVNGLTPVFVEVNHQLAEYLKHVDGYVVHLTGIAGKDCYVSGYDVLTLQEIEKISNPLADCLFMATAVGGENLKTVAPVVALGLERALNKRDKPLNILVCENWPNAENVLAEALLDAGCDEESFACVRCSVERMVRRKEKRLDLVAEGGQTFFVDSHAWKGEQIGAVCEIEGLKFTDNIGAIYARKLYTSNAGGAALAYLGSLSACQFLYEALEIPEIRKNLTDLLNAAKQTLNESFGIDMVELEQHITELISWRFPNRDLADTVERVARNPLRKLGFEERLAGLAHLLGRSGLGTKPVSRVIGAALHYREPADPDSVKLGRIIAQKGVGAILEDVCGFEKQERCYEECIEFYNHYS